MATHQFELNNLRPQGASPIASAQLATPTPDPLLLSAPLPSSSVTSSADNSSTQLSVPKSRNAKLPLSKRLYRWWPELTGAASSIILLIAIIVFLALIDGSKMNDWHFAWQIKPPTIISILVTLCRINLAFFITEGLGQLKWVFFEQREHQLSDFECFDEATRGPWGATCFVWKVHRRAVVATCGAVLAVLILAMDPFSQQVLYYSSQTSEIEDALVTLPSARSYNSGALYAAFSGDDSTASSNADVNSLSTSASSPSNGEFGSTTSDSTSFKRDASDLETIGAFSERDYSMSGPTQGKSNCSDTLMARAAYAGLFTSISPLDVSCPSGSNCTWPTFTTLGVCSECNNITSQVKASCNSHEEYDICWYEMIGAGDLPGNSTYPGPNAMPSSFEEFSASTKFESKCTENGVRSWPLWFTWASRVWDQSLDLLSFTSYRFPKNDDAANTTCAGLKSVKPPDSESAIPMQGLVREDRACPMSSDELAPYDIFWVNKNDHQMTVNMLSPLIDHRAMSIDPNGGDYDTGGEVGAGSDAIATAFWDNHEGNLSLTLADITTAMTNRDRGTDGFVNVDGTSTSVHTVIKVTWYWLVYMVAMVLLSLTFFVTAMVFASEKSQVVWKSSTLAALMHGLEGFDRNQLEHRSLNGMSKEAKELWAQLREDDDGNLKLFQHR